MALLCRHAGGLGVLPLRRCGRAGRALPLPHAGVLGVAKRRWPCCGRGLCMLACRRQRPYDMPAAVPAGLACCCAGGLCGSVGVPACLGVAASRSPWHGGRGVVEAERRQRVREDDTTKAGRRSRDSVARWVERQRSCGTGIWGDNERRRRSRGDGVLAAEPRRQSRGRTASSKSCGAGEKMGKSAPGWLSCGTGSWGGIAAKRRLWWQSRGGRVVAAEPWRQSRCGRAVGTEPRR